jgi:predicted ArsR family transcriptional regulator
VLVEGDGDDDLHELGGPAQLSQQAELADGVEQRRVDDPGQRLVQRLFGLGGRLSGGWGTRTRYDSGVSPAPERAADDESFTAVVAAVTNAFGDTTRRQIYLHVRDAGGLTAGEVAKAFALHPNVARHHLDKLAAGGYLEVSLDHNGSGAGRPSKRYRCSSRATPLPPPPRPDVLLARLLARALELLDPDLAARMAEQVGEEFGRSLAAQMAPGDSQRSLQAAMAAVADSLTAQGFAARAENDGASTAIVRNHCPFSELVAAHPVLCHLDRGLVQGLLAGLCGDSVPVRMSSRALGDDTCASVAG